jgi:hypothetical protein
MRALTPNTSFNLLHSRTCGFLCSTLSLATKRWQQSPRGSTPTSVACSAHRPPRRRLGSGRRPSRPLKMATRHTRRTVSSIWCAGRAVLLLCRRSPYPQLHPSLSQSSFGVFWLRLQHKHTFVSIHMASVAKQRTSCVTQPSPPKPAVFARARARRGPRAGTLLKGLLSGA